MTWPTSLPSRQSPQRKNVHNGECRRVAWRPALEYIKDKVAVTQAASSMGAKDTVVVKLDWLEAVSASESSVIAFQEDFRGNPNEMRTILFGGTKDAPLYAEWIA